MVAVAGVVVYEVVASEGSAVGQAMARWEALEADEKVWATAKAVVGGLAGVGSARDF